VPRATYNLALGKRRISSVRNYFDAYSDGTLGPTSIGGFKVSEASFGETTARPESAMTCATNATRFIIRMPRGNVVWKLLKSGKIVKKNRRKKILMIRNHSFKFARKQNLVAVGSNKNFLLHFAPIFKPILLLALAKKRVVKDYDALPEDIIRAVKMRYPTGFAAFLVQYTNQEGKLVSAFRSKLKMYITSFA
jgi:hypothetical protein